MITTDAAHQREDFLARLDAAMHNVPHGVATEIRAGIVEELDGLDAAATAARIAQFGDPAVIAHEAQAATHDSGEPALVIAEPKVPMTGTKGFAIAAALTLSFGGILVPAIGWVVGVVMVCISSLWRTWEKTVAIVVPLIVAATVVIFGLGAWYSEEPDATVSEAMNPLVPAPYDFVWMGVFGLGVLLIPASGLWLLWRLRRRVSRVQPDQTQSQSYL